MSAIPATTLDALARSTDTLDRLLRENGAEDCSYCGHPTTDELNADGACPACAEISECAYCGELTPQRLLINGVMCESCESDEDNPGGLSGDELAGWRSGVPTRGEF